jgi:DNA-binding MarR family transcriptional regulator
MNYANDVPTTTSTTDLASALRLSVMRLGRRLRHERTDATLSLTQLATLATLYRHGPLTPRELAERERVQPPSMTRVLAALEERGLVDRVRHPTDGRQVLVSVTETARKMLTDDRRRREAWLTKRLGELTSEERETLHAAAPLLERLAQA